MSAIVLAGGSSTRLGRDKALERLGKDSLLEIVIESMIELCDEVLVVIRPGTSRHVQLHGGKVRVIYDNPLGRGPLAGLFSGLTECKSEYAWAVGCDMPFLNQLLLKHLMTLAPGYDAVVPRVKGLQPLHAVYSKSCLPAIKSLMTTDKPAIYALFKLINVRYVDEKEIVNFDPIGRSFFNINTEKDLALAKAAWETEKKNSGRRAQQ